MKIKVKCPICRKIFLRESWAIRPVTCSKECGRKLMSKKMKGNNYGFKKGHKVNEGRKQSKETKDKLREIMTSPKRKKNIKDWQKAGTNAILNMSVKKFVEGNPTRKIGKRGYLLIYIPKLADYKFKKGWRYYHHYIWETFNKRAVPKGFCIHHKDGNKLNNLIQNLQLMTIKEHDKIPKKVKKSQSL